MVRGRKQGIKFNSLYRYKIVRIDQSVKYYHTLNDISEDLGKTILTIRQWLEKPFYTLHKYKLTLEKLETPIKAQTTTIITHNIILPTHNQQEVLIN